MRAVALALAAAGSLALGAPPESITAFSSSAPGAVLPAPWRALSPPRVPAPQLALEEDAGATVLRVRSVAAAGTVAHALRVDPARRPVLAWRWKVDRVVERADLGRKDGDDFAARVYVFFDVPASELAVGARVKLALARLLYGQELPSAAICYVWDNRHAAGTSAWSPYTDHVRVVVLESGAARAGQWIEERRDLAVDFRAAFGARARVPEVSGIAAGNDTDQTGETATAWFGDFRLETAQGAP